MTMTRSMSAGPAARAVELVTDLVEEVREDRRQVLREREQAQRQREAELARRSETLAEKQRAYDKWIRPERELAEAKAALARAEAEAQGEAHRLERRAVKALDPAAQVLLEELARDLHAALDEVRGQPAHPKTQAALAARVRDLVDVLQRLAELRLVENVPAEVRRIRARLKLRLRPDDGEGEDD